MNPLFHTGFSISDSLKYVRKSVLIYETIINSPFQLLPHPEILPWMLVHQNVPLLCCGNMGVDFRDVDGTVTKHFLDVADIHIGF